MDVWDVEDHPWLIEEKRAIRRWVRELDRPFLGLCLGHQLLADALAGTCGPQRPSEIGILDVALTPEAARDPVFAGLPEEFKVLQWHSVKVAQPPDDAIVLARSDACSCQAMRAGRRAWSMQYHVEIEPDTIAEELAKDAAVQLADTVLLTVPSQLGVEYNAAMLETIAREIAPSLGWSRARVADPVG